MWGRMEEGGEGGGGVGGMEGEGYRGGWKGVWWRRRGKSWVTVTEAQLTMVSGSLATYLYHQGTGS